MSGKTPAYQLALSHSQELLPHLKAGVRKTRKRRTRGFESRKRRQLISPYWAGFENMDIKHHHATIEPNHKCTATLRHVGYRGEKAVYYCRTCDVYHFAGK